jgi:glycosyltransferase involved in cell wall biosynthesis
MPRISLVIPAFNEEQYLPALLDSVDVARARYSFGPSEIEVIVADNCSTDRTAEVAASRGCRVVRVEKRAIGAARNGGASAATGHIVAFVDADYRIHPETFNVIERTMADERAVAGGSGAWFSRLSLGIALTVALGMMLFTLANLEIGVIFCRRADWEAVGGYNEDLLCAEDVEFLVALKKLGRSRKQRFIRPKGARAITSARKFDRHGEWHYCTMAPITGLHSLLFNRAKLQKEMGKDRIQSYWYDARDPSTEPK